MQEEQRQEREHVKCGRCGKVRKRLAPVPVDIRGARVELECGQFWPTGVNEQHWCKRCRDDAD